MADEFDNASALEELERDLALANRHKPSMAPTGYCYNCHAPIPTGNFCDNDCCEDWQKVQWAKSHRQR